jgi:thioesterase domain-containing protein
VSILVLLDTPLPMRPHLSRRDKTIIKLAELRAKGPQFLVEWARNRLAWERGKRLTSLPLSVSDQQFHNAEIEMAFRTAISVYRLEKRAGRTLLFRPPLDRRWKVSKGAFVSQAREYVFADNNLTPFAPALQVIEVPGNHDSMVLEPNVRVLAAHLRSVIAQAEQPTKSVGRLGSAGKELPLAAE